VVQRQPRVFFSFRSPYSWLALEHLSRAVPDMMECFRFVPFWDPDAEMDEALKATGREMLYVQMSKAKHLYLLQDTKRIASQLNLSMAWPIDIDPWWEVPHLAWLEAARQRRGWEFYRALVEARWWRGANICDPNVVSGLADQLGMNGPKLANVASDPDTRRTALDCLIEASDDGIFGIPYFRLGRQRFWGLDRVQDFIRALQCQTTQDKRELLRLGVESRSHDLHAYDRDTAGGCG
jgi:2-hydroxychromene-2-carboxylate isomerase